MSTVETFKMSENMENGLVKGPLGVRTPPEAEVPITFVYSQSQNDIHAFLPEDASMGFVKHVADNLR